jgi:hypothetical protein
MGIGQWLGRLVLLLLYDNALAKEVEAHDRIEIECLQPRPMLLELMGKLAQPPIVDAWL